LNDLSDEGLKDLADGITVHNCHLSTF
jgi:hypothetical protein